MIKKIENAFNEYLNINSGDHITVALSGGRDSIALTHALFSLREKLGITVSAAHCHHGLRAASDEEEIFVKDFCDRLGIELEVFHLELSKFDLRGISVEMAARDARYAVYAELTDEEHSFVATAHHLDDCMETMLINLCRGCGSKGLSSIPGYRDGVMRPMLDVTSGEIDAYIQEHDLPFVEDESNKDTHYLRNFIRHEILAKLKERTDISVEKGFAASLRNLREEDQVLDGITYQMHQINKSGYLGDGERPLVWRYLKALCPRLTRERFDRIYQRLDEGEKNFNEQICGNLYCFVRGGVVDFDIKKSLPPMPPQKVGSDGAITLKGGYLTLQEIHSEFTNNDLDCAKIKDSEIFLRGRKAGDRIRPVGRNCTKTLGRLFSEMGLADRELISILANDEDQVIWVEGVGADESVAPDADTKTALRPVIKKGE